MFTLGDKQRVLNANADVSVIDASGAAVTASANVLLTDTISVEGFGKFAISDISDMKVQRAVTAVNESKDYTCVAPSGLSIGDAVEVLVYAKTSRYQSELKNNFIGAARPLVFMTAPLTAITAGDIRDAIVTAWTNRALQFNNEDAVISVTDGTAGTDIQVATAAGYESVEITKIELKRSNTGIGTQTPVALAVAATNAVANEGLGLGSQLEQSVKMATGFNTNPYGVDNASTGVDIRGEYAVVNFEINASYDENLSTLAADHGPLAAKHRFTIYLNEATCLGANDSVSMFAAAAILAAGANAGSTATAQTAPLTRAQEETESLIIENGNSVSTVANFIA